MELFWKGKSDDRIDILTDLALDAYLAIDKSHAIIMVKEDPLSYEDAVSYFHIEKPADRYVKIMFSPERLISDIDYIFQPETVQSQYEDTIREFCRKFSAEILLIAKESRNMTRAEAVRIVWKNFGGTDLPSFSDDTEAVQELIEATDRERITADEWVDEKFCEFVIKYSIYLTVWEKVYTVKDAVHILEGNLSGEMQKHEVRSFSENIPEENEKGKGNPMTERGIQKQYKAYTEKHAIVGEEENLQVAREMENSLYDALGLFMNPAMEEYRMFFYKDSEAHEHDSRGIYDFFSTFRSYYLECLSENRERDLMGYSLGILEMEGDITCKLSQVLMVSTEIILRNEITINERIGLITEKRSEGRSKFIENADRLQFHVFPNVFALRDELTMKIIFDNSEHEMLSFVSDLLASPSPEYVGKAEKIAGRQKDEMQKLSAFSVLGGAYMFGSRVTKNVENHSSSTVTKAVKDKDKDARKEKARMYWRYRKKGIARISWDPDISSWDRSRIRQFMKYLYHQIVVVESSVKKKLLQMYEI